MNRIKNLKIDPHEYAQLTLFIFGCARSSLLHGPFSSRGKQGLLSSCGVWASHCCDFPCCGAGVVGPGTSVFQHVGSVVVAPWAPEHRVSS